MGCESIGCCIKSDLAKSLYNSKIPISFLGIRKGEPDSCDKKIHAFLRKRVSAAYSILSMLRYEEYMQECLDLVMMKLKKHAQAGTAVDMAAWTGHLAFDIVSFVG